MKEDTVAFLVGCFVGCLVGMFLVLVISSAFDKDITTYQEIIAGANEICKNNKSEALSFDMNSVTCKNSMVITLKGK